MSDIITKQSEEAARQPMIAYATPKSTDDLERELSGSADLNDFLSENSSQFCSSEIPQLICDMQKEKNISKAALAEGAGMSRIYLYQILNGKRIPSRDRMISLCFGLKCSYPEAQKLLRRSGFAMLYAKVKRDATIIYALENGWNVNKLNDMLFDIEEKTLF